MAMQTIYFKEHEGLVRNTIGQLSSVPSAPWWSGFGSQQSIYGESCGQLKPLSMEFPCSGDQLSATKQAGRGTELAGPDKGNTSQFTIFPGKVSIFEQRKFYLFLVPLHLFNHCYPHSIYKVSVLH